MTKSIIGFCAVLFSFGFSPISNAGDYIWSGGSAGNWSDTFSWQPAGGVPGQGDNAVISGIDAATTIRLDRDVSLRSLRFDPGSIHPCTIEQSSLTLTDGGQIHFARLPGDVGMGMLATQTIESDLKLSGSVTLGNENRWYLGREQLVIAGRILGTGTMIIGDGAIGSVRLSGDNSNYTGSIRIKNGRLLMSHLDALGSGRDPIRMDGGVFMIDARMSTSRDFLIAADAAWDSYGPNGTHDGTITVARGATWTVKNGGGNTMKLTGAVSGEGNLTFTAHGTTICGPKTNTLSGTTTFGGTRGYTLLAKPDRTTAVAGPVVIAAQGTLRWGANDQISDRSSLTFDGKSPTLMLDGHKETIGTLDLRSDGAIDPGESTGRLAFADCSTIKWNPESVLLILGGGNGRGTINFGGSDGGLTAEQLAKIGFVNPAGYPPGTYTAKLSAEGDLLPTGRLVEPLDLPIDLSDAARARRKLLYDVRGRERLTGTDTRLRDGMTISIFGDSITWGGGYTRLIDEAIKKGEGTASLKVKVINHGVNGGGVLTIRDGDDSKNHAGGTRPIPFADTIAADKSDVAVIYIGVNDVWWRNTEPEVFDRALRDLVARAQKNRTTVVLATLAIMKESVGTRNAKCDKFAEITRKVARETDTVLVDLRAAFMAYLENESIQVRPGGEWRSDGKILNHDGVHANQRGNELLADMISQGIWESLK